MLWIRVLHVCKYVLFRENVFYLFMFTYFLHDFRIQSRVYPASWGLNPVWAVPESQNQVQEVLKPECSSGGPRRSDSVQQVRIQLPRRKSQEARMQPRSYPYENAYHTEKVRCIRGLKNSLLEIMWYAIIYGFTIWCDVMTPILCHIVSPHINTNRVQFPIIWK